MNPVSERRLVSRFAALGALLVAPLLALWVVIVSGRGSVLPIALDMFLAAVAAIAAISIAARTHRAVVLLCALEFLALGGFMLSYRASPLPEPPAYAGSWPLAAPPPSLRAYRLTTGVNHRTAAFGYRGGGFSERRDFTMTAVLLRHPRGDVLIDTGFGRRAAQHFAALPLGFRLATSWQLLTPVVEQLAAAHYNRTHLRGVLLTHAHWDHVSGLADMSGLPALIPHAERRFIADSGWIGQAARDSISRIDPYDFDAGPYLGFAASHDFYGDGSVVIVPAPGHTPGSVIIFVTLPSDRRYAFVGDLAWQLEGVTQREERPWLARALGDSDPAAVRDNLLRVYALQRRFPDLSVVPAHDPRGFASLEPLPAHFE